MKKKKRMNMINQRTNQIRKICQRMVTNHRKRKNQMMFQRMMTNQKTRTSLKSHIQIQDIKYMKLMLTVHGFQSQ